MRYNRFREKKLKMRDIFDAYCAISSDLQGFDSVVNSYGDFNGDGPNGDPMFMEFGYNNEEDYNDCYYRFLETALEEKYVHLYLSFYSCNRCYKVVLSLLNSCECLKTTIDEDDDDTLYIEFPTRPSYEELEDIKDTFDEICDVLRRYRK